MSRMPSSGVDFTVKIRRSVFTGILIPASQPGDVKMHLARLKKEYHTASHICWGYRIYDNELLQENASDAGEPAGTAGLPILNALKQADLVNSIIYVIRIYGGQKLGKQGLIEAYGTTAQSTIEKGKFRTWILRVEMKLTAPIEYYGILQRHLEDCNGKLIVDSSTDMLSWRVSLPKIEAERFSVIVKEKTNGQGAIKKE